MSEKESSGSIPSREELQKRLVICRTSEIVAKIQELLGKYFKLVFLLKHPRNDVDSDKVRGWMTDIAEKVYAHNRVVEAKGHIAMCVQENHLGVLFDAMYCVVKINGETLSFDAKGDVDVSKSEAVKAVQRVLDNPMMLASELNAFHEFDFVAFLF